MMEPRILAVVLPHLLCELGTQRLQTGQLHGPSRHAAPRHAAPRHAAPRHAGPRHAGPRHAGQGREPPRAILWTDLSPADWDSKTELDAVNSAAYQLGVRPRQTIGQARAIVEHLILQALPRARVSSALKNIAEVALGFGSPVSFQAPDTVWVDVSGSSHLYESERVLALELGAQIKLLGHSIRMAIAGGPWLAQSFARYSRMDSRPQDAGALLVDPQQAAGLVGELPIISLPIEREAVTWFSRLGLLSINDLRKLPRLTLASRLDGQVKKPMGVPIVLDLIHGHDAGVLTPHRPEELPLEELFWEDPLESVEPLLFALKGLASRLSARLEGRGQAARELLLTIHHDRRIAALNSEFSSISASTFSRKGTSESTPLDASERGSASAYEAEGGAFGAETTGAETIGAETARNEALHCTKKLTFQLASPLFHAEDLERAMRLRLQRQSLSSPHVGLSLQATSVAEARCGQVSLSESQSWKSGLSTDPRTLTVLVAELTADLGAGTVGVLVAKDSHLLEKSSDLAPVREVSRQGSSHNSFAASAASLHAAESSPAESFPAELALPAARLQLPRLPTRLLKPPIEVHAPIRENELWVVLEQAFIVRHIRFDERVEGVEWWDRERVFRDYFRVWLAKESGQRESRNYFVHNDFVRNDFVRNDFMHNRLGHDRLVQNDLGHDSFVQRPYRDHEVRERQGLEALVYRDREQGKSYIHAIYD